MKNKMLYMDITKICNNNCIFCYENYTCKDLIHIQLNKILEKIKNSRLNGFENLTLSGGEPTIHPDFLDVIGLAKKEVYKKIRVVTNGRMFSYKSFLDKAVKNGVNEIVFSFHSNKKDVYEQITQVKGSFLQLFKAVKNASNYIHVKKIANIVVNANNNLNLPAIVRFLKTIGMNEIHFSSLIPFGKAAEHLELFIEEKEYIKKLIEAIELCNDFGLEIQLTGFKSSKLLKYREKFEVAGSSRFFKTKIDEMKKNRSFPCKKLCNYCYGSGICKMKREGIDFEELLEKKTIDINAIYKKIEKSKIVACDLFEHKPLSYLWQEKLNMFLTAICAKTIKEKDYAFSTRLIENILCLKNTEKGAFLLGFPVNCHINKREETERFVGYLDSKNILYEAEIAGLKCDVKKVAKKEYCAKKSLEDYKRYMEKKGFVIKTVREKVSKSPFDCFYPFTDINYDNQIRLNESYMAYISKSKGLINELENLENQDPRDELAIGAILGYTKCGSRLWEEVKNLYKSNIFKISFMPNIATYFNTEGKFCYLLNNINFTFGIAQGLLCSYNCEEAIEKTKKILDNIKKNNPKTFKDIEKFLRMPILYFTPDYFVHLDGKVKSGSISYKKIYTLGNFIPGLKEKKIFRIFYQYFVKHLEEGDSLTLSEDKLIIKNKGDVIASFKRLSKIFPLVMDFGK